MKKILIIVHQATSDPGLIGHLLQAKGYQLDIRCPAAGAELPETMESHEAAIVFGGPMSANDDDTLPFIRQELDWIPTVLAAEKPFLGICLGAQMLARVLGTQVTPRSDALKEIGYFPIDSTRAGQAEFGRSLYVYQWHGEGFELPREAVLLASGDLFPNQAFRYGDTAYGLQFHPEITAAMIQLWTTKAADQLLLPNAQSLAEQLMHHDRHAPAIERWLDRFLNSWLRETALKAS